MQWQSSHDVEMFHSQVARCGIKSRQFECCNELRFQQCKFNAQSLEVTCVNNIYDEKFYSRGITHKNVTLDAQLDCMRETKRLFRMARSHCINAQNLHNLKCLIYTNIMLDALSPICINEQEHISTPLDIRSRGEKHTQFSNERYITEMLKTRPYETKMAEQSCFLQHRGHGEDNKNACFGTFTISL